ncbi:MAG: hypothetical protein ACXVW5_28330 [Solirubrobacteraceae bacterium]
MFGLGGADPDGVDARDASTPPSHNRGGETEKQDPSRPPKPAIFVTALAGEPVMTPPARFICPDCDVDFYVLAQPGADAPRCPVHDKPLVPAGD